MKRRQFLSLSLAMCCGLSLGADPAYKYRCPTRSSLSSATGAAKWGKTHLTYYIKGRDTGDMKRHEWDRCFLQAFKSWSDITPLTFEKIYDDKLGRYLTSDERLQRYLEQASNPSANPSAVNTTSTTKSLVVIEDHVSAAATKNVVSAGAKEEVDFFFFI